MTGEQCSVKRQRHDDQAASKEVAAFNFFSAFPHDNVLRVVGMFVDEFKGVQYLYIITESCGISLWKKLAIDDPEESKQLLLPQMSQFWLHGVARGVDTFTSIMWPMATCRSQMFC